MFVQNQHGPHPNKWDRTGIIVECRPHNRYMVKIDATGRLMLKNRQFLRKYIAAEKNVLLGILPTANGSDCATGDNPLANCSQEPEGSSHDTGAENDIPAAPAASSPCDPDPNDTPSPIAPPMDGPVPASHSPRRSARVKQPSCVYDLSSGKYISRTG